MVLETQTEQSGGNIAALVAELDLRPHDQELFMGRVHGFPVGVKFIGSNESLLLLCQIRYPIDAESQKIRIVNWGEEVDQFVKEKKVEISVENKIAWLTIPNSGPLIAENKVAEIVYAILDGLEKAGANGLQDKCHYCQVEPVQSLVCKDGKVAQICEACLTGKGQKQTADMRVSAGGFSKAVSLGAVASLVGAVIWALVWVGVEELFEILKVDHIAVPRIVEAIVLITAGFLVGGPIGFILRKIPNRGDLLAGWLGAVFGLVSIVVGEIFFSVWLVYKFANVISIPVAIRILPRYLADVGPFYLAMKFMLGVISVVVAYHLARPEKKGLKL